MPKYLVEGSLTCYWSAEVEAKSEQQAREKVDYDDDTIGQITYENDYDSSTVDTVTEME